MPLAEITPLFLIGTVGIALFLPPKQATRAIWLSMLIALGQFFLKDASSLSQIASTLIVFISGVTHSFSLAYLEGDTRYKTYFRSLTGLTLTILLFCLTDNLLILTATWALSNYLLSLLMTHNKNWKAAHQSGSFARKNLAIGSICLLGASLILGTSFRNFALSEVLQKIETLPTFTLFLSLLLLSLAALIQSAAWPFHRWLLSSLNSPTPISAFMHAGLINGGGLLICKFAPLYANQPLCLNALFVFGAVSALLGSFWKLLQNNIKSMLACSTMAQTGFMIMQCGLGLFPAAIAHLCLHGCCKAFLFLHTGSALQKHKPDTLDEKPSLLLGGKVLLCAALTTGAFTYAKGALSWNSSLLLLAFTFVAGGQIALTLLKNRSRIEAFLLALISCVVAGVIYGKILHLFESLLPSLLTKPQPLNILHIAIGSAFLLLWVLSNFFPKVKNEVTERFYAKGLNASQAHPSTLTKTRTTYTS